MKIKIKFEPPLKEIIRQIKSRINAKIFIWFKKLYQDYIKKRFERECVQKIHEDFERKFGVKAEYLVGLMKRSDASAGFLAKPTIKMTDAEYKAFLLEELKKSAISLNEIKPYIKASVFYDPDITDIHNESIE